MKSPGNGYDYPTPQPPTGLEILQACEVLLRAGYTMEALSVLQQAMPHVRAMKFLVEKIMAAPLVRKGETP